MVMFLSINIVYHVDLHGGKQIFLSNRSSINDDRMRSILSDFSVDKLRSLGHHKSLLFVIHGGVQLTTFKVSVK